MKRSIIILLVLFILTGCQVETDQPLTYEVEKKEIERLLEENKTLRASIEEAELQLNELLSSVASYTKSDEHYNESISNYPKIVKDSAFKVDDETLKRYLFDQWEYSDTFTYDETTHFNAGVGESEIVSSKALVDIITKALQFLNDDQTALNLPKDETQTASLFLNADGSKNDELVGWALANVNGETDVTAIKTLLHTVFTKAYVASCFEPTNANIKIFEEKLFIPDNAVSSELDESKLTAIATGDIVQFNEAHDQLVFRYMLPVMTFEDGEKPMVTSFIIKEIFCSMEKTSEGWRVNGFEKMK